MMLKVVKILLLFALLGVACIQAVVVGPQPLHNNNRNGYRYNGPAHKYLPSEESHSHGSHLDSSHKHGPQGTSDPYNSHHYPAQQHHEQGTQEHDHQQKELDSWQSPLAQQQHQSFGNQPNHQNAYNEGHEHQQHHGLNLQQHHELNQQQHYGSNQQYQSYGQQHYQQSSNQLQHHQSQHLAEPAHFQQQQPHEIQGHKQHQQRKELWDSVPEQQPQEHEPWHSSQSSHGFQQQQQQHEQFRPQQHHNRFEQQLPLREDLWQPIRELDLEKLPSAGAHATSHKTVAAPGRDVKLVPSYTLSSDFEHDRFIGLDGVDTRLLTQSLPDAYRKQLFSSPPEPSSLSQRPHQQLKPEASDFLQMQSHSYQLPSTFSTHAEWPQDKEQQQATGNRQYSTGAYAVAPSYLHTSEPHTSQPPKNSLPHPSRDFQPPYY
ncbi:basic-leucine zipper transcription factor A [Drosophila teissieri]|uniref:basic-leucine zipper transcription factor A n=1 Tax=Drosophila teissieri TaxID=7243 RepID=UPI001CB9E7F5|nr:basic-leucine zipper transcription factor A [Drosophila teissieri]